ncbi:hypothetical protein Taro_021001 [Colocasia esculenta]|uniref:Uncharacterized protein n=1 Tax=Colocasia esculenta TaxID=4460 RepID=A0A843V3R6_COLES|nr:hypothetical protein [Colocasia esculenta]
MMKKRSSGVDTESGLDSVSTQSQAVSTPDPVPRRPVRQFWTLCRHCLK